MDEPRRQRLKPYNSGAALALNERRDLLIAQYFPSNEGIHMTRLIVQIDGVTEFAEYLTRPPESPKFWHRLGQLSNDELVPLRSKLLVLCPLEKEIAFDEIDCDYGEYQEPRSRLLRHWCNGVQTYSTLPTPPFFSEFAIDDRVSNAYRQAFEAAWGIVAHVIDRERNEA